MVSETAILAFAVTTAVGILPSSSDSYDLDSVVSNLDQGLAHIYAVDTSDYSGGGNAGSSPAHPAGHSTGSHAPTSTSATTAALRDCGVLYGMASDAHPWASSLSCIPGADNGTLTEGVFTFVDTRTGEVVETAEPVQIIVTASDLQSLPINPGAVTIQPDTAQMLIHQPLIAHSDAGTHTLATTILGVPVNVRVTPLDYTWDFGNGEAPLVTTSPGGPYPDFTVSGTYTSLSDGNAVTLTTRWSGEFQVAGIGPWLPVNGTAATTSTSRTFDIYEAPARLTTG